MEYTIAIGTDRNKSISSHVAVLLVQLVLVVEVVAVVVLSPAVAEVEVVVDDRNDGDDGHSNRDVNHQL